ncbi:MAG: FAD-dependent oxidoreductase [Pseudomonadota bacterium]
MEHYVVVGAGQAGCALVTRLRNKGFEGDITLIGAEEHLPYQRPPLSKGYLLGDVARERLFLKQMGFYSDENIQLRLGSPVTGIDPSAKTISFRGETISYDKLALTCGLNPRRLPADIGGALEGVFGIRTLADVDTMAAPFSQAKKALVVGGGYIGLEGAAVARKLGLEVTLIEAAERILNRVAARETADYFRALHGGHGVRMLEGTGLARLTGDLHVTGAELSDGSTIEADVVLVGIGMRDDVPLASDAGLEVDRGIVVDDMCQTSDARIWAAGDCTAQVFRGRRMRIESVQNAIDQAEAVADNMLGANQSYDPKPWFWSDQYDVKLQIAGLNLGYSEIAVRSGADEKARSHWYYNSEGGLIAVDAMNDPRAYMIGKRLIESGKSLPADVISDPASDLKSLMKSA